MTADGPRVPFRFGETTLISRHSRPDRSLKVAACIARPRPYVLTSWRIDFVAATASREARSRESGPRVFYHLARNEGKRQRRALEIDTNIESERGKVACD